jgi:restriction system protein
MARRRQGGIDVVASLPWWIGIVLGVFGYLALRHGIGWYFAATGNPALSAIGKVAGSDAIAPLAWMLLAGCWIGALFAFLGRAQRRKLLDSQTGVDSLRQISWRQFEQLAGEAFRRQGYVVEET